LRNFCFLSPTETSLPEEIAIEPDAPLEGEHSPSCEGERESGTHSAAQSNRGTNPRKRKAEATIDTREPRRTRGIWRDYRYLADPFPDEKEAGMLLVAKEEAFAVIPGDNCHSLKEARESPDWPEWEHAIHTELKQLCCMGTWKLVDKPASAVPIANKWVFAKKRNKEGILTKYKARLVAKGCAQRLGHDYIEMHSPVVHLETIRAILAIVLRSSSPPFYFSTLLLFQSRDLERHLTSPRDLRHMVDHLISHLTFLSHDHLIVLTDPLFYCSNRLLFTFPIVPVLLYLTPLFSKDPLFASLGRLVR